MSDERSRGEYVRKVHEVNRRHSLELLTENEALRARIAQGEAEREGLSDRLRTIEPKLNECIALRALMGSLERDKAVLQDQMALARQEIAAREAELQRLRQGLLRVEDENRRHAEEHSRVEQQNSDLANLYVASYRLHGALDRDDLIAALLEIVANVIGCEEALILEMRPGGASLELAGFVGLDPEPFRQIPVGRGRIGQCAADGELFVVDSGRPDSARPEETHLSACIPLKLQGEVTGVIALFRLLPQKISGYESLDHEVFDLLGTHAATALYCSALHTAKRHQAA